MPPKSRVVVTRTAGEPSKVLNLLYECEVCNFLEAADIADHNVHCKGKVTAYELDDSDEEEDVIVQNQNSTKKRRHVSDNLRSKRHKSKPVKNLSNSKDFVAKAIRAAYAITVVVFTGLSLQT